MSLNLLRKPMTLAALLAIGSLMIAAYASGQDGKPQPPGARPGDEATALQGAGEKKPVPPPPVAEPPKVPGDVKQPAEPPKPGPAAPAPPPTKPGYLPASVNVQCLPNATIWIEGQKMTSAGQVRSFQSPALEPGKVFYYTFKVSWPGVPGQNDIVLEQEVTVRAGQTTALDFRPQAPVEAPRYSRPIFREGSGIR